jgi:hypothetical protein
MPRFILKIRSVVMNITAKYLICLFLFGSITIDLFSQGEIMEQPRIFYRNEESIGVLLNSNGIGLSGRYAIRINARKKHIIDVDFVGIKHSKEYKYSNPYNSNRTFVFGKLNSFFNLRAGYGRQKEIYRKVDKGGISIRRYFSFGPTLGILKPIYYEILEPTSDPYQYNLITEKFVTHLNQQYIYGKASFFKGIDEISVVPGGYGKLGISFEYSKSDITLHALETGLVIDVFPKKIPIMDTEQNDFLFLSLFISYRFGRVVDKSGIIDEKKLMY